jgi:hypothetical protein
LKRYQVPSREKHHYYFNEHSLGAQGVGRRDIDRERYTGHGEKMERKRTDVDYGSDWSLERHVKVEKPQDVKMERKRNAVDYDSDWSLERPVKVEKTQDKKLDTSDKDWGREWSLGRDEYVVSVKTEKLSSEIEGSKSLKQEFKESKFTLLRVQDKAPSDASDDEDRLKVHDNGPRTPGWVSPDLFSNYPFGVSSLDADVLGVALEPLAVNNVVASTSKNAKGVVVDSNGKEFAEYEITRLEKIENNKELLIRLQIDKPLSLMPGGRVQDKKRNVERGSRKEKTPTRKSPRMSALPIGSLDEEGGSEMEFDNFEDVGLHPYSSKRKPLRKESMLSQRSPNVGISERRAPPLEVRRYSMIPSLGPFNYERYEALLHEKVRQMRPVFGFTEMHAEKLDQWIIKDRNFVSTHNVRIQLMIHRDPTTIYKNLVDIMNLLGYSKKRARSGDEFSKFVWCPHIVLTNIFKGCTKKNLVYDEETKSYIRPGIDLDSEFAGKHANIQILCPFKLHAVSERIRGDSGQEQEPDLVSMENLIEFADFEKILKMELDPEKFFFPFMSLDSEENRELFEVKGKAKNGNDFFMVRLPGVLNLTTKREIQILAFYQCLQNAMSEGIVHVFKPTGEWD